MTAYSGLCSRTTSAVHKEPTSRYHNFWRVLVQLVLFGDSFGRLLEIRNRLILMSSFLVVGFVCCAKTEFVAVD